MRCERSWENCATQLSIYQAKDQGMAMWKRGTRKMPKQFIQLSTNVVHSYNILFPLELKIFWPNSCIYNAIATNKERERETTLT